MMKKTSLLTSLFALVAYPALAEQPAAVDTGNTAWLLLSAALVMLMTPGLAFFYAGDVVADEPIAAREGLRHLGALPLAGRLHHRHRRGRRALPRHAAAAAARAASASCCRLTLEFTRLRKRAKPARSGEEAATRAAPVA